MAKTTHFAFYISFFDADEKGLRPAFGMQLAFQTVADISATLLSAG